MLKENGNEIVCNEVENFFFLILSIDMRISFHVGSILEKNSPLGAMSTWACVQSHVCGVDSLTTVAEVPVLMVALSYPLA